MARLGTIKGTGVLVVDQQRFDPINYWFEVKLEDGLRSADGRLTGDRHGLEAALKASSAQLELQDGTPVQIVLTGLDLQGASAVVNGRIPGY
jgi:hypothetical protein